jgi:phosphatidylinositol alpha-mannosyltransferase
LKVVQLAAGVSPFQVGGVEVVVASLSQTLARHGHRVVVLTKQAKYTADAHGHLRLVERASTREVLRFLLLGDYDLLHIHGWGDRPLGPFRNELALLMAKLRRKPVVSTPHGALDNLRDWAGIRRKDRLYARFSALLPLRWIDRFICIYSRQPLILRGYYHIPERKLVHIPNGIPEAAFLPADPVPFLSRYKLEGKRVITFVGRLDVSKRVSDLVEVMPEVNRIFGGEVALVIIGRDEGEMANLTRLVENLRLQGSVLLLGEVSDLEKHQALSASELFVSPSSLEAFGISTVEAMAHGIPVISADNQGAKYVLDEGRYGLLYEIGNKEQLLERIVYLLANPDRAKELGERGRGRAEEFRWERISRRIEELYASCLR